jgi:hypothetical protein
VVGRPLHGVVYFSEWWLVRRLSEFLLHFPLGFEENGAIFGAMVGFTSVVHAVLGFHGVWASVMTAAMIWGSASLGVWRGSLIEGSWVSFLWRWSKNFLLVLWWPATIKINVVHRSEIVALIIIVTGSCSFEVK